MQASENLMSTSIRSLLSTFYGVASLNTFRREPLCSSAYSSSTLALSERISSSFVAMMFNSIMRSPLMFISSLNSSTLNSMTSSFYYSSCRIIAAICSCFLASTFFSSCRLITSSLSLALFTVCSLAFNKAASSCSFATLSSVLAATSYS